MQTFLNTTQISKYFCCLLHAFPQPFCIDPTHFVHTDFTDVKSSYSMSTVGTVEMCLEQFITY